jgi:hypothetical protein
LVPTIRRGVPEAVARQLTTPLPHRHGERDRPYADPRGPHLAIQRLEPRSSTTLEGYSPGRAARSR